eukprot:1173134-Prorocentrum_minimum.AAC.1
MAGEKNSSPRPGRFTADEPRENPLLKARLARLSSGVKAISAAAAFTAAAKDKNAGARPPVPLPPRATPPCKHHKVRVYCGID